MRNEQDRKKISFYGVDRKRGAVERDGAFLGYEPRKVSRNGDLDAPHAIEIRDGGDLGGRVHMAGDEMAAKFLANFERPLEIEFRASAPMPRGRAGESFRRDIDLEPASMAVRATCGDGQTRSCLLYTSDAADE